jgi:hypothetical protein
MPKDFSDAIWYRKDGRYVTESRLKRMITMEGQLIEERLSREKHKNVFSYANTVATIFQNNLKATDG